MIMKKTIKYSLILSSLSLALVSCQDDWNGHYDQSADTQYGTSSLYEVIAEQPELSDFCKVLQATKAFANSRQTNVTYADLLGNDQFFTVWAPVNGSFNCDSILQLCKTSEGDSLVELQFVKNHLARYSHSFNGKEKDVLMLNGKTTTLTASSLGSCANVKKNISVRNGVLHTLATPVPYYYNIYEALVAKPEYRQIGSFLRSYQIDELDELQSLAMGIVDGKTVYIDSVFASTNELLDVEEGTGSSYGHLDREDSTYWAIVPTPEVWDSLYEEAKTYYNYAFVEKADSVHARWSHYALMQDMVFNPNKQKSIKDSIVSTTWTERQNNRFHTYYKPLETGGLFNRPFKNVEQCSNGIIYQVEEWPFNKYDSYFRYISVEAEGRIYKYDEKKASLSYGYSRSDSISNNAYIILTPTKQVDTYYLEYELPDVLSGTYDICIVFLPRNVDPTLPFTDATTAGKRNMRSAKFSAELTYAGTDGEYYKVTSANRYAVDPENPQYYVKTTDKTVPYLFDCNVNPTAANRAFINDPFKVDTVKLCTFHFPTCNYDQKEVTNRLKISNAIASSETNKYWNVWFIDRILLLPHKEEENN